MRLGLIIFLAILGARIIGEFFRPVLNAVNGLGFKVQRLCRRRVQP